MEPIIKKIPIEPSTLENIDLALYTFIDEKLNIRTNTNEGIKKIPIIWAGQEASKQKQYSQNIRDKNETFVLPIISIKRLSKTKNEQSKGLVYAKIPAFNDARGGLDSVSISTVINQDKTSKFANADSFRKTGALNFPRPNKKVVYSTTILPNISWAEIMYEINVETEYQQQMNDISEKFMLFTGNRNDFLIRSNGHKYEAFLQDSFSEDNIIENNLEERRTFMSKIQIKVFGYLTHNALNDDKPSIVVRENFVEVKIPKESIILDDPWDI